MQIIEMYEPDEDLKKKGNKSEKKEFSLFNKSKNICNTLQWYSPTFFLILYNACIT